jgi:hypothetical protein
MEKVANITSCPVTTALAEALHDYIVAAGIADGYAGNPVSD